MRRDYFTCVFLGLIAGALAFVCFKPLYFTYNAIIPRDFSILERLLSVLYTLFFVFFLPFFAAFKKKEWVNWGLAAYGLMAYLPLWFYPAPELIQGEDASLIKMAGALVLRGIYAIIQAPFAALSKLIGNSAASKVVYWILPVAIAWPVIFRIVRFYRRAYLSEQLNPMPTEQTSSASKAHGAPGKPEVLGTVITAPVTAQTPADITRKNQPVNKPEEPVSMFERRKIIKVNDRGTMLNMMVGLNGYTLCSGIICEELNGTGYKAIPYDSREKTSVIYVTRAGSTLSGLGKEYIDNLMSFAGKA